MVEGQGEGVGWLGGWGERFGFGLGAAGWASGLGPRAGLTPHVSAFARTIVSQPWYFGDLVCVVCVRSAAAGLQQPEKRNNERTRAYFNLCNLLVLRQHGARLFSRCPARRPMQSLQVRCPQCSHLLGASGGGQHSMFNIRCAACGTVFGVQVAQPVGPAAPPPPPPSQLASFQAVPTATAVQNLCALGFSEAQTRDALRSSNGDVERAATLLLATPRETSSAASPSHAATPTSAGDAEDRELQQALEASRHEARQNAIPVAVAVPATAGSTAPVAAASAVGADAAAAAAGTHAAPLLNTTVELQGLVRRPELNGQQGIAQTFEHGRYQVRRSPSPQPSPQPQP